MPPQRNPIAGALRNPANRMGVRKVPARKGKGSYSRKAKHRSFN